MKKTILVVDDDVFNLSVAKKLLEIRYDVICVPSGKQALVVLQRRMPDLILLDISMPEMDGFEVIKLIKEHTEWSDIPVIFLTASTSTDTEAKCLEMGAVDFIGKPFEPAIMLKRVERSVELYYLQFQLQEIIKEKTKKLDDLKYQFTYDITEIVESRDVDTGGHIQRTCNYVELIVNTLRKINLFSDVLTDEYTAKLIKAAALHDLGKIKVSDIILNKPGKLTDEEFVIMKNHVIYGKETLQKLLKNEDDQQYYQITHDIVLYHHEKWDGSGYMAGLSGEDIPLSARIMAVADVFDALVAARCYKKPFTLDEALDIIAKSSGSHFDPVIAQPFLQLRPELEIMLGQG